MKLFKSEGSYQQAYSSKFNDVTAYHSSPKDISLKDYASALIFKMPQLVLGRLYYRFIWRIFDRKPSKDLTNEKLYSLVVNTGLSRYVRNDVLDLKYFENIGMRTAYIELDHENKVAIAKPLENESATQALDRAQRACFLATPIHYHSFVHFHAPTAMAIYAAGLDKSSFKRFLERHTRYTLIYNNGGISASSSEFFCKTLLPDYSNMRASDSILSRAQQYWDITQQTNPSLPLASTIANPENFTMDWEPSLKSDFPFDRKIMRFYPHIQDYVESQNFSTEELSAFSKWFSENIYPIPEHLQNTTTPLSYLVWSNSVVHSLEHAEYFKWKDYARYGEKTANDSWYRYFMHAYAKPYGSFFRNERLSQYISAIKDLDGAKDCYVSIQF